MKRAVGLLEGGEELVHVGGRVAILEGHWMKGHEEPRPGHGHVELARERLPAERLHGGDPVDPRAAHRVDAPGLLPHLRDAPGVRLGRGEVEMRELGDGVADLIVHRALGHLAAVDVRHRQRKGQSRHRCGQHLEAIAEHHEEIGAAPGEGAGKALYPVPRGSGDGLRRVAASEHGDALGDGEAVGLDLAHGGSERGIEVGGRPRRGAAPDREPG
jgi:hypothetical protein